MLSKKSKKFIASVSAAIIALTAMPVASYAATTNKTEKESNNTRATANVISVGETYTGKISTKTDIDCYKFVPAVNDEIRIDLTNIPSGKKYNLWIQDSNGNELARETSANREKYLIYKVTAGRSYYFVVNGSESSANNYSSSVSYKLKLRSVQFSYLADNKYCHSTSIKVDLSSLNSTFKGYFKNAMSNWSGTATFTEDKNSNNKVYTDSYPDSWYGLHSSYKYQNSGEFAKFEIKINQRTLKADAPSGKLVSYYKSTMTHELGHTLGLADNPVTNAESLMKHNRDRALIIKPQEFDKDAVNHNLGSTQLKSTSSAISAGTNDENPDTGWDTIVFCGDDIDEVNNEETLYDEDSYEDFDWYAYFGTDYTYSDDDDESFEEEFDSDSNCDGVDSLDVPYDVFIDADYKEYDSISDVYANSDLVVVCTVGDSTTKMLNVGNNGSEYLPYTVSNINVIGTLKGYNDKRTIKVKQLGGTINNTRFISEDVENLNENDMYVLFLKIYDNGVASLINPVQGMYHIDGSKIVSREENDLHTNVRELISLN